MTQNFANAGVFLIQTFVGIYFIVVLLRFLMQVSRVDYYNPICQAIVKVTDPPVKPLKKLIPTVRGIDFATLIVALIVQLAAIMLVMLLKGGLIFHPAYIAWALVGMVSTIFDIYFFALLVMVIASWIAPYSNHPVMTLVHQLTEPICTPARKLLPPMGGLDFSIILVFVAITLIDTFLIVRPLAISLGIPPGLVLGLY
ncbi:MAG: YggT family protein [Gammaproteobacteria bacterium]|jgi:YggT family protein|nr:YggT family protein [Gammaproteobacteria bacterium]MBT4494729.1 YggT family protein [Gammaproteobacteria bacterium]MBT7372250.1 YggT family protein [Gammaproteobacteria bacterium]